MIQLTNTKLIALMCLVMSVGFLASCEKEEDPNSGKIELLSFGPTGANHGDTLRFFGRNMDEVTAVIFTGTNATVEKAAFKKQTSTEILLIVPEGAEKGFVTLKTPQGDIVTKTILNLGVTTIVSSFTSQARPGSNITISGNFLNWVESITFAENKTVTNFVSQSLNELIVTVPEDAETGPLIIKYGGTDSMVVETDDTLFVTLPIVTGYAANPVKHAENVTINGTDLDLVRKLYFTGVPGAINSADFVSQTASQIVVTVPGGAKDGAITLEAASGVQTTSSENLNLLWPSVATMSPNPVDPGADLTITGTNLDLVTSVTFENAAAVTNFVSQSPTQLVVTVPNGVAQGRITLGVLNSTVTVLSTDVLNITGAAPPPTISFPIYDDGVTTNWTGNSGWVGGGWGGTADYNNGSPVRVGTKSVKINYVGGWGSPMQLGGANIDLTPFTSLKISVYGGPGSNGKKINVGINTADKFTITLEEGKWVDYAIPVSSLGVTNLNEIWIKEYNGSGGFSIYVDALGLN